MAQPVFRFAPSPNGRLHLGHAYSALLNERIANDIGGRLLLRLEDIDTTRCTETLVNACVDDLRWLGFDFEENPRRQSEHMDDYRQALGELRGLGLLYPCSCSRAGLLRLAGRATDPDGQPLYDGHCLQHGAKPGPQSLRLNMARAIAISGLRDAAIWGDVILARKDIGTSYHISVVVDDALQGVTHVVRGQDLELATSIHELLQNILGLPTPLYTHHPLIKHETGRKLAKSASDRSLHDLRNSGVKPAEIRAELGF